MNLMMLLEMAAQTAPERVAIGGLADGYTYDRLFQLSGGAARWLREQPSERVVYSDVSSPALPVALLASSWAGQPFVPVSYRLAPDRLRAIVANQAPAVVLHGGAEPGPATAQLPDIEHTSTSQFVEIAADTPIAEPDWSFEGEDVAILLHTSGTSGEPKVAVLRQRHLVSYVLGSVEFLSAGEDEATLVSVPPYHIAGMAAILTAVYGGRRLVQLPAFESHEWVRLARDERITHAMVVPTMLGRILDVLEADGERLPHLRHLSYGGGRMPLPVVERALALLPQVDFVNAYGLTETSSSITVLGPDDHRAALASDDPAVRARLGSVGQPLPNVELSIRDPMGVPVTPGSRGEVWVRGEQVSGEYAHTTVLDEDGWFTTRDAGWLDDEGYLFLDGRIDDVIVRGGENLSPGEIEDVLLQHPAIREAVVLGVPDQDWGEVVAAVVVPHEGQHIDEAEVRAWVTERLRSSRAPSIVELRDQLPYNETGKVLRRVLKPELARRADTATGG
jgi:acyl-CoA synthetase (AMP-forming)/AMP-acid ligase II